MAGIVPRDVLEPFLCALESLHSSQPPTTGCGLCIGTDASYKSSPTLFTPESNTRPHFPRIRISGFTLDMTICFIARLFSLAKRVEYSDRRLKRAQELFAEHQAVMDQPRRTLAQSLLDHCGDLREGLEAKCLFSRIKQARLYSTQVDKTLKKIQAVVGNDVRP